MRRQRKPRVPRRRLRPADEFTRQRDKLLQALAGLDADIIGLNEIENTPGVEPLARPDRRDRGRPQRDARRRAVRGDRHRRDRHRRDPRRADLPDRRGRAGRRLQDPRLGGRPALHRHAQPARARPDVRGPRDRRAHHGRRQPPQVEGLGLHRRRRPADPTRRRAGQLQRHRGRWPPRRSSTGSPPTRPGAATATT